MENTARINRKTGDILGFLLLISGIFMACIELV
jgi:hypothetical protein